MTSTIEPMNINTYLTSPNQGAVFYTTNNVSNIIFEFTAFNISSNFSIVPSFDIVANMSGLSNVSAVAQINISASSINNLFYFETYPYINTQTGLIPLKFGINTNFSFNLSYSNSSITYGLINTNASYLYADYVNYLAYAITGGYNTADIFQNEDELINGVTKMDVSFNNTINYNISNVSNLTSQVDSSVVNINGDNVFFDNGSTTNPYILSCQYLLDGLLEINSGERGKQFLSDIAGQNLLGTNVPSSTTGYYYIPFHKGDILSLRLSYVPFTDTGSGVTIIGNNPIYTRSYKIVLNCTSD
jgi:hypothetical protein